MTDDQGRWESDALSATQAAAGKPASIQIQLRHTDFVAARADISIEQARARSSVLTMKQGGSLSGKVVGPDGRPVAGASVVADQSTGNGLTERTETDGTGQFRFGRCLDPQGSPVVLTVLAPGLAGYSRTLLAAADIPAQVIQLDRCHPLRGRVVDSQGHPVAGAVVESTRFSGHGKFDWRGVTDARGRFEWQDAPTTGPNVLDARKPGYEDAILRTFDTSQRDVTFTLHRPLHLHGTVTDAATGRPIERFDLIAGWGPERPVDRVEWLRGSVQHFGGGRYDLRGGLFPDQGYRRSIRIESEGYLPAELIGFRDNAEEIAHDFKLRRALPLAGIVRGPDGRPLAGAQVALSGQENDARIVNGRLQTNFGIGQATHATTGPDGRYTFRPQDKPVAIVVAHEMLSRP